MKAPLLVFGCFVIGAAACTAPHGQKLGANSALPAPVAAGPETDASNLTESQNGEVVAIPRAGQVTLTLGAADQDGYTWRLAEIPDDSVLKLVSQEYIPPADNVGRGQEKWVFQATGPGEVPVKMWYGNTRVGSLSGNPTFDFTASVSDQAQPKHPKKSKTTTKKTVAEL
ncbi:MAG TPA: protease inhibitor I42 family protein [Chthoniobacter sp.]|jgi:predicted secreted protein